MSTFADLTETKQSTEQAKLAVKYLVGQLTPQLRHGQMDPNCCPEEW